MIQVLVRMVLVPEKQRDALQILRSVAERTRAELGCIRCSVYQDSDEQHGILYEEVWRSEDEMQIHLRSQEYRNLLLVLEMALKPPEITFNKIISTSGVEIIEKVRMIKEGSPGIQTTLGDGEKIKDHY
jgi:quinol monooxygenase YgiN